MEIFVHVTDPEAVLAGFYHVLCPGGHPSLFEYDHELSINDAPTMARSMRIINDIAAMPTNSRSHSGVFQQMLEDAGFTKVTVRDYSDNTRPMTRLFYLAAYIPFLLVALFGLGHYFINAVAGVESYRGNEHWRYVAISAKKPGGPIVAAKDQ
jgi:sterol 24-C-methyltransferase